MTGRHVTITIEQTQAGGERAIVTVTSESWTDGGNAVSEQIAAAAKRAVAMWARDPGGERPAVRDAR